jgi:Na+-driven multidrug efflux pump
MEQVRKPIEVILRVRSSSCSLLTDCPKENYRRVGIILQRSVALVSVCCIPVAFVWWFCEDILVLLKQDPKLAKISGRFVR